MQDKRADFAERIARALSIPQHHTGWDDLPDSEKDLFYMQTDYAIYEFQSFLNNPLRHDYWGAGEANCPREIKAGNGELHTLRCKACGKDNPRSEICHAGIAQPQSGQTNEE